MTTFNRLIQEKLLADYKGEEFYIGSSGGGLEKLMNASPSGVLKGSVLVTGDLVVWVEMGHSEAYKLVPEMKPFATKALYNFYLNKDFDPMSTGKTIATNVVESSASNDKSFSSEQKKLFPKASGKYSASVVDTIQLKIPFAEWILFDDAIVDAQTGEVVKKFSNVKGGMWLKAVSNFFREKK